MPEKETEEGPCTDWRPAAEEWRERAARNGIRIQLGHGNGSDPASSGSIQTADRGIERMTEEGQYMEGPYGLDTYVCPKCGNMEHGWSKAPKCFICEEIENAPPMASCPFCGSGDIALISSLNRETNEVQIQAECAGCGARTGLYDYGADAAKSWNRRTLSNVPDGPELKACPFCGGKADIKASTEDYAVVCTRCGNRSVVSGGEDTAEIVKAWNKRTL